MKLLKIIMEVALRRPENAIDHRRRLLRETFSPQLSTPESALKRASKHPEEKASSRP